jgi:hypothetical protein
MCFVEKKAYPVKKKVKTVILPADYKTTYSSITKIDKTKFSELSAKLLAKIATKDEHMIYEKYKFTQIFKNDNKLLNIFFEVFLNIKQKHVVYNLLHMKNPTKSMTLLTNMNDHNGVSHLEKNSVKQSKFINDLVTLMGLTSCHDIKTVIEKKVIVNKVVPYFEKHYESICESFYLTVKPLNDVDNKYKYFVHFLRTIFIRWCGCSISINEIDKHANIAVNYVFKGWNFYEHIKVLS